MNPEELREYPTLTDPLLELEAPLDLHDLRSCVFNLQHHQIPSGRTIVFMDQQREGNEPVYLSGKFIGRKYEHGIIVAGYLVKPSGVLAFLKKDRIQTVPDVERDAVKSDITEWLSRNRKSPPAYIEFWQ